MPKYRLYIDEVGNSDLRASQDQNHRYLSLTGVIVSLDYVATDVHPQIEDLKRRYFGVHPDQHVILHRSELVNQRPPFEALQDPNERTAFNARPGGGPFGVNEAAGEEVGGRGCRHPPAPADRRNVTSHGTYCPLKVESKSAPFAV